MGLRSERLFPPRRRVRAAVRRLFKNFSEASKERSETELPWEPSRRYSSLARSLRRPRGSKSAEHLANLRRSDPLINLCAWHDWAALYQAVGTSRAAHVHQQALITRGLRAHQLSIAATVQPPTPPRLAIGSIKTGLKTPPPVIRLATVEGRGHVESLGHGRRDERASSDSVIAFLDARPAAEVRPTSNKSYAEALGAKLGWAAKGAADSRQTRGEVQLEPAVTPADGGMNSPGSVMAGSFPAHVDASADFTLGGGTHGPAAKARMWREWLTTNDVATAEYSEA